jgi:IS5 family transposase
MQLSFLDTAESRLLELSRHGDPLERLNQVIDWQLFAPILAQTDKAHRKSNAGRPRTDSILLFKILILKKLYALSDDAVEYHIRDRLSFMRFLGLSLHSKIPDAKTVWLFADTLAQAGLAEPLFERFNSILQVLGVQMTSGQLIDASFIEVPKQRNSREDNALIKQEAVPLDWQDQPAKRAQKDINARWTKKNNEKHFGYKDHINVDKDSKLITKFEVTDASVHDSQALPDLLRDATEGGEAVYADGAYKSKEIDGILLERGLNNKINERGYRNKPLTEAQIADNTFKSRKRSRVEHVFGSIKARMHGTMLRSIGLVRAKFNIGVMNLTYNLKRVETLIRLRFFEFDRVVAPTAQK